MPRLNGLDKHKQRGNIVDRVKSLERSTTRYARTNLRADELSEIAQDLGEMVSGEDSQGPELADPTWTASTSSPNISVYTTDPRMPVSEFALMDFRVDMEPANRVFLPNENGNRSYLKIAWYDALSGGSELSRDDLAFWGGVTFRRTLLVPVGAVACAFVCGIAAHTYGSMGLAANHVENFSAREMTWARRLSMDPLPSVQIEGAWQRIASGARMLPSPAGRPPGAAQVTTSGNLSNGAYRYKISWVDEFGETTPGMSVSVAVDATHKQVTITPPLPIPAGVTAWRIYRTLVNGLETDPFYLVATLGAAILTYQDNIADANLGAAAPEENTTLGRPVLPIFAHQAGNTMRWKSALDWTAQAAQIHGEYWRTPDTVGEWAAPDPVLLEPGRYQMTILGLRGVSGGITAVYMDGQIVGTINQYNATTAYNYQPVVNFVVEEPGLHEFLFVAEQAGTGGNYRFYLTEYWVRRVGR